MKWNKILGFLICVSLFMLSLGNSYATDKEKGKSNKSTVLEKTAVDPGVSCISINNISLYVKSTGDHPLAIASSWNGAIPKGSNLGAIYKQGIVWGGLVSDGGSQLVRTGGSDYNNGNAAITRLYRVRRDVRPQGRADYADYKDTDLRDDAANFNTIATKDVTDGQMADIRAQYEKDWNEWATSGGPYDDVNKNGRYDPLIDIPGVSGADQSLVINYSDENSSQLYRSNPIGLSVQEVFWAYAASNPLGNVIFQKVRMAYTGLSTSSPDSKIDSMYIAQFSDPDLGQYTDDFAGCFANADPSKSLNIGYIYNSSTVDALYGAKGYAPPSVGYDFLQGASYKTGNLSDSAIVNLKWVKGRKYFTEVPMSAFIYYAAGGTWGDPTTTSYNGTLEEYNYLRGYQPIPRYPAIPKFPRPSEWGGDVGGVGTYLLDGDPIAKTGWRDGEVEGPGDRRILCVNGPFSMKLGDTVEVVLALVAGLGSTNLSSVAVMKYNDIFAQYAYDNLFDLPSFPAPTVDIAELDKKLVINWGVDNVKLNQIESGNFKGYLFEGYNVYQLPTPNADLSKAKKIATFDLVNGITTILDNQFDQNSGMVLQLPAQIGKNSGIQRSLTVTDDAIRSKPLADGQEYYFAVTAYGYNPDPNVPYNSLESVASVKTVTPQSPKPGVTLVNVGAAVTTSRSAGTSDGSVSVTVSNPLKVTGDNYKVTLENVGGAIVGKITDVTKGTVVLSNIKQTNTVYVDGLLVTINGASPAIKSNATNEAAGLVETDYAGKRLTTAQYDAAGTAFKGNTVWHSLNSAQAVRYLVSAGGGTGTLSRLTRSVANAVPYDYSLIWTGTESTDNDWGAWGFDTGEIGKVPFQIWRYTPGTQDSVRLLPFLYTGGVGGDAGTFKLKDNDAAYGKPCTDWIYWYYDPAGYDAFATACAAGDVAVANNFGTVEYWARMIFIDYNSTGNLPPRGTVVRIYTTKPNTVADAFTFTAPKVGYDADLAKTDIEKINVFPNPYYGYQERETSRAGKYVTFNHLPQKAIVKIIDLAGNIVRVINKDDQTQFITWDLRNQNNYPVASGVYIVYVDMPDLGKTKILKSAIIQEEQVLPVF